MPLVDILKTQYINWLSDNYSYKNIESEIIRIDTPFLDNEFDNIILYVEPLNDNKILITDDGYTLSNLDGIGFTITPKSKKRNKILQDICNSFGVIYDDIEKEINIIVDVNKFAIGKHRLLQAILRINDMFLLNSSNVTNLFYEEVENKLITNDILYAGKQSVIGPNGMSFFFDFTIPVNKKTKKKDKLVRTISTPNKLSTSKILSTDVRLINKVHKNKYDFFVIYNDVDNLFSNSDEIDTILNDAEGTEITPIKFSEIDEQMELLKN